MFDLKKDLRYTNTHEWIKVEGNVAKIGITAYATNKMGKDLAYVEMLKDIGESVEVGEELALLDVVKTTESVVSPVSGKIKNVNKNLEDEVELLSEDPYGEGWIVEVDLASPDETSGLLSADEYAAEVQRIEEA